MNIKTLFIFFTTIIVFLLASFVVEANRNVVEAATLSLSYSSSTSSSCTLRYSYSNATSPTIYRNGTKVAGLPSGSNSGSYTNRNLSAGTTYTYTLRSGNTTKTATCRTSGGTTTTKPTTTKTPSLSLSCSSSTSSSCTLRYSYSNATSPTIYRNGTKVAGLPSGSNSGSYTNRNLSAGTTYTYTLRSGNTTRTATCRTSGGTTTTTPTTTTPKTTYPTYTTPKTTTPTTTYPTYSYTPTYAPPAGVTDWKPWYPEYTPTYADPTPVTDWKPWYPEYTPVYTTTPTPSYNVRGNISCVAETENSVTVVYNLENGNNASIFRGDTRIHAIGLGTRSGSFVESGLAPGTSYDFYLRDGLFSHSDQLSRVVCRTKDSIIIEESDEFYVTKTVKSKERDGDWLNSITVSPGEVVSFSIKVTAGDKNLNGVDVRDILPNNIEYLGNLKVDGNPFSGSIIESVNIGSISRRESKTVTFDAKVYQREYFVIGTTSLTNTVRVTAENNVITDIATLNVIKGEVAGPPTTVPTGITGKPLLDYILLPILFTLLAFLLFRKQIVNLVKKIEDTRREVRAEWI
jgi:hypothetical protein